jgi:hypothetical protein
MHFFYLFICYVNQYNSINQICTKKRKPINSQGFHNPKIPTYKHIYLFITLFFFDTNFGLYKVPQDEAHGGCCDEFVRGLGRRLPVNFGMLDRCLLIMYLFIYLFILYRSPVM